MKSWAIVQISEFLFEREGRYKPEASEIAGLRRIDKIDFSGNFYLANKASKTDMIRIKKGDLVISGINVAKGALGVYDGEEDITATIHYSSYTFDEEKISVEYFKRFLRSTLFVDLMKEQVKGGIKTEIKPRQLLSLKIPLPNIKNQLHILNNIKRIESEDAALKAELAHQRILLKKLRQNILQEAIEGEITTNWRKEIVSTEPAAELLKRIKVENESKRRNSKLQDSPPPLSHQDNPFELPDGWALCRLGEYANFERGKFSIRPRNDPSCFGGNYPFIQIGSLDNIGSEIYEFKQTLNEKGFAASKLFPKGTIAIAIVGGTIANLGLLGRDMCFPDSMVGVRPSKLTNQRYIHMLLRNYQPAIRKLAYQMAGQPNIKLPTLKNITCGLPPLLEQQVIVDRVEELFAICDKLESKIGQNQNHANQLMQAVLNEAFSNNTSIDVGAHA